MLTLTGAIAVFWAMILLGLAAGLGLALAQEVWRTLQPETRAGAMTAALAAVLLLVVVMGRGPVSLAVVPLGLGALGRGRMRSITSIQDKEGYVKRRLRSNDACVGVLYCKRAWQGKPQVYIRATSTNEAGDRVSVVVDLASDQVRTHVLTHTRRRVTDRRSLDWNAEPFLNSKLESNVANLAHHVWDQTRAWIICYELLIQQKWTGQVCPFDDDDIL